MARPKPALLALARRRGILPEYVDATGRRRRASAATLRRLLLAERLPVGRDARAPQDGTFSGNDAGEPLIVRRDGPGPIPLRLPRALRELHARDWRVRLQGARSWRRLFLDRTGALQLPAATGPGVHRLRLVRAGRAREIGLVIAPARLSGARGPRQWGLFAPLYALRSRHTWGCGDLRALEELGLWAARFGASVIATLPLLPAFLSRPYEPSPYRPVSRQFWNEVYLDPSSTPEFRCSPRAQALVRSAAFRRRVARLERRRHVDFRAVARLKRSVVELLLREFARAPAHRQRSFRRFVDRADGLAEYARFRASGEPRQAHAEEYHRFVQWLVTAQLEGVVRRLRRRGVELALDLPIGIHPDGFDPFRDRELYVRGVSVGSPPDPGVPQGQNWHFPPWDPHRLARAAYRPFADALAHQLGVAGWLRIDHALGLHRLYWVPDGSPPRLGAYVRYPAPALYAVVLAQAARAGATIVGEDLGTVPPELRPRLRRHGLLAMYVAQSEWSRPGRPRPIPAACVVSLNTHDHPPFAAFWARQRAAGSSWPFPGAPAASASTGAAFRWATAWLARSPARLLLVNLEDLWGETRPQNVPGRIGPDFSRRCRRDLATLGTDAAAAELLSTLAALRPGRYDRWFHRREPGDAPPADRQPPGAVPPLG